MRATARSASQLTDAYSCGRDRGARLHARRAESVPGAGGDRLRRACPGSAAASQEFVNDATDVEAVRERWLTTCEPRGPPRVPVHRLRPASAHRASASRPAVAGTTTGTCVPYGVRRAARPSRPTGRELRSARRRLPGGGDRRASPARRARRTSASRTWRRRPPSALPVGLRADDAYVNDPTGVNAALQSGPLSASSGGAYPADQVLIRRRSRRPASPTSTPARSAGAPAPACRRSSTDRAES